MTTITEGKLIFSFPSTCQASQYDEWSFYRNQFQSVAGGCKAVDILCGDAHVSWLIEVKDYRCHPRTKPTSIADELTIKARDTLAGLAVAAKVANVASEQQQARKSLRSNKWRIVLHLEQPSLISRLRPKPLDIATLLQKLRTKKLKAVDVNPIICDRTDFHKYVPWTVQ